ncbi:MAG: CoB--CoM heterodisulfide reductase iron-sulfur subunit B family protein [Candidatus Nezhaarchaeota archaeon]|nr:CoB--CoM heterodisulfide reductase iron-sulfur subunit B family protein [Candidatus Nezhaarchaeota archaeon]
MPLTYAMFWSCWIETRFPNIEASTRRVMERLGIPYRDMEGTSCCPEPFYSRVISQRLWLTIAARNLSIAEAMGLPVLTMCNGCYETLFEASELLREDPSLLEEVNKELSKLGRRYRGAVEVKHIVEALYEAGVSKIKEAVVKPLRELRVAIHPGCHLYRSKDPGEWRKKADELKEIVEATGAKIVSYKLEKLCCGFPQRSFDEELSLKETLLRKLESIRESEADLVAVTCPTCYLQFEVGQGDLKSKLGVELNIPVVFFTELLALSFGRSPDEVGLGLHRIPVTKLTEVLKR